MKSLIHSLLVFFLFGADLTAQPLLSLKSIYQEGVFVEKQIDQFQFHPDGRHFVRLNGRQIQLYDLDLGQERETVFAAPEGFQLDGYTLSADGRKLLLRTRSEPIYRHSQQAAFIVYETDTRQLIPLLEEGKQRYASFSPDGRKAAFVYQNNLYYRDLETNALTPITTDGQINQVINGAADWVYEEEFGLTQAYAWSPDGRYLAFLRFDESQVPEFTMTNYRGDVYPEYVTWKYPKAGQTMATVTAHIFDLQTKKSYPVDLPEGEALYLPRLGWSPGGQAYFFRMNRRQNRLELWLADPADGEARRILTETDAAYVKLHDNLTFLPQDQGFLWTSERDGWNHLYHYGMDGRLAGQITKGEWEVGEILGFDARNDLIYYQSSEKSPLERHLYSLKLNGGGKQSLTSEAGWHEVRFSPDFQHFLRISSDVNRPPSYGLCNSKGALRYWLEENRALQVLMRVNETTPVSFWNFATAKGDRLLGWMIKPPGFQKDKKYPALLYVYGGPGSQRVANRWNVMRDYWWFQLLAQNGYIVACVDNRGTGGRGAKFQKQTYLKLGELETQDQIEAARYLAKESYVDPQRIGVYGKSYGGYLATMCLLRGGDVFSAGIALAPVTDWRWYDGVYTERYMRTPAENPDGYRESAAVAYADQLVDPLFLVHGLGDDNVHFQHSAELAKELTAANKPFDTHFYPNIDHSLRGGNTAVHLYTKMTDFLDLELSQVRPASPYDRANYQPTKVMPPSRNYDLYVRPKTMPKNMPKNMPNNPKIKENSGTGR